MRIGINGGRDLGNLDGAVAAAKQAADDGFPTYWLPQIFGLEALSALAIIGREVPDIDVGTAVVPTYPRHPMVMAGLALTAQAAMGSNRLKLGIGLSHQIVVEAMWGYSFDKPVRHMAEYLDCLIPLLAGETIDFHGESISCSGAVQIAGAEAPEVLVAALGPQMLKTVGSRGCGTITWCTGPKTLADHIVPGIRKAADDAGQGPVRVVAALPVGVSSDADATRARAADELVMYGALPSYRAMLDREGVEGPADLAIVGDEETVAAGIAKLAECGVDEFCAAVVATSAEDAQRTNALLAQL